MLTGTRVGRSKETEQGSLAISIYMLMRKEPNKAYNNNSVPRTMTVVYTEWEKGIPLNYRSHGRFQILEHM